ncbi:MAG: hypothetical protein JWQ72_3080, partial [Polaromonas sp.]|nr:hypothetical protein [Polaromonas sp.]
MPRFSYLSPLRCRSLGLWAAGLWLCCSACAATVPERLALLGRAPADVRDALATTEAVRAPRRLASGAVGLLRVPETVLEGLRFEEPLFFS